MAKTLGSTPYSVISKYKPKWRGKAASFLTFFMGAFQALTISKAAAQQSKFKSLEGARLLAQNPDGSIRVELEDGTVIDLNPGEFRIVGDDVYAASSVAAANIGEFNLPNLKQVATIAGGAGAVLAVLPKSDPADTAPPVFTSSSTSSVNEGLNLAHTISATDQGGVTYSLVGGADQASFSINPQTGELMFSDTPDFETSRSANNSHTYAVVVRATDASGNFADATVIITVTDVDEAPQFAQGSATVSVDENTSGAVIYTAMAQDVIPSDGSAVVYSLDPAAIAAGFSINPATGEVRLNTGLDYERATTYGLTITAKDQQTGASSTQGLTVNVRPVNEAPEFSVAAVVASINENSTAVIHQAVATDPDTPETLTYSLDATSLALGFVISSDGKISHSSGLDYETDPQQYNIEVTVTDAGGLSATQNVIVRLNDVDETSPTTGTSSSATMESDWLI